MTMQEHYPGGGGARGGAGGGGGGLSDIFIYTRYVGSGKKKFGCLEFLIFFWVKVRCLARACACRKK